MWQEILIIIIGLGVVGYVGYKIYRFFTRPSQNDLCAGCPGCSLSEEMKKRIKDNCEEKDRKNRTV